MELGLIIFFVIVILATCIDFADFSINAGNILHFWDTPSFIIVLGPTILFAIGVYSWDTYVKTCSIQYGNPKTVSSQNLLK